MVCGTLLACVCFQKSERMLEAVVLKILHDMHTVHTITFHHNHTLTSHPTTTYKYNTQTQGATEEHLQKLQTPESYADFAQRSRPDVEVLVKLSIIFQDIVDKVNAKAAEARASGSEVGGGGGSERESGDSDTEEINFTTAEGATVTGTITATNGDDTDTSSPGPLPLEVTPEEVHAQLDEVEVETTLKGEKPVNRDAVM